MHLGRITKWIACSFGMLLFLAVFAIAVLIYLLPPLCENERLATFVSPGGVYQAVIFRRNCGATTPFSLHVSALPAAAELPNEAGNVLIIREKDLIPTLSWRGSARLAIEYPVYADVSHVFKAPSGVSVEYAALREHR